MFDIAPAHMVGGHRVWPRAVAHRVAAPLPPEARVQQCSQQSLGPDPAPSTALPSSLLIQWHITERCNLRCSHCYQEEDAAAAELTFVQQMALLRQFEDLLRAIEAQRGTPVRAHVTITGGEPFLHQSFAELLEATSARRDRWSFAVLSNGTVIDGSKARALAKVRAGFVQVSIEGTRATHDAIRGPGSHDAAVAGLRHLVRAGVPTMISFTATADNYREFPAVADLGRRLRVGQVWADRMVPLGRGDAGQVLTPEQTREFVEMLGAEAASRHRGRTRVAAHRALQFAASGGRPYRCAAGGALITVLPNGDICPCRRMPIVVGNAVADGLTEVYLGSPLLKSLREYRGCPPGCETCFYSQACAGGLRCLAAAVNGNPFTKDPGCWLAGGQDGMR